MTSRPITSLRHGLAAALLVSITAACGSADDAGDAVDDVVDGAQESTDEANEASNAIADAFRENGLESLASAVDDVDFAELAGTEEFTFFAPNDEAFQTLDADSMADLLSDPDELRDTLRNHIVAERIESDELGERTSLDTAGGMDLSVASDGGTLMIQDASVVDSDIEVDEGVVHVVDGLFVDS